jgi:glycosyltransferase involved in cell wall biosynthesis
LETPSRPSEPISLLVLNPVGAEGWGGVEQWLSDLAVGLRERGHRVSVAGRPGSLWMRRARDAGFPLCEVPLRADFQLGQARKLSRFMLAQGVDVIATKLHRGIRVAGFAAKFAGDPPVVAFMGLVETRPGLRYRLTYELFLDRIVTLSEEMRREIADTGDVDPSRIEIIPQGIRMERFDVPPGTRETVRRELGVAADAPVAVAIGRLHLQKRFDHLLDTWQDVVAKVPAARLFIAGEGRLAGEIEARRRALRLEGSVTMLGFRADVPQLLAAADCLVMSSDDEGVPVVAIEAMAAGRAVVATEVGSIAAAVEHGRTGLLVPRQDRAALGSALVAVLGDAALCREMGRRGRAKVRERFELEHCIAETERFLVALASRAGA